MSLWRPFHTLNEPWDLWVGPGPEPKTGRRLYEVRFRNRLPGPTRLARALAFARFLYEPEGVGFYLREQARRDLKGKKLGCRDEAHGLTLAHAAQDRPLEELLDLIPDVLQEVRNLFERSAR